MQVSQDREVLEQATTLLNSNKNSFQAQAKEMMSTLDTKAEMLQQHYDSCYSKNCLDMVSPVFQQMYEKGTVMELGNDEVFIEKTEENRLLVDTYNNCVTACEKPIRDLRFTTEFQVREFQLNLNECFNFCRAQETVGAFRNQAECLNRCFDVHQLLLEKVKNKLVSEYDTQLYIPKLQ